MGTDVEVGLFEEGLLWTSEHGAMALRALAILAIGGLVAWSARFLVRKLIIALRTAPARDGSNATAPADALFFLTLLATTARALDALPIEALEPARDLASATLAFLPRLAGALAVFAVFFLLARVVQHLIANLLATLGIDRLPALLGAVHVRSRGQGGGLSISTIAGYVALTIVTALGARRSVRFLDADEVTRIVDGLISVLMPLLMAWIVFAIGLVLGQLAFRALAPAEATTRLAWLTRAAILAATGAVALRTANLEANIVVYAYGVSMAAAALAFGLGGRDAAARLIAGWRGEHEDRSPPVRGH